MKINIKESTIIRPAQEIPKQCLRICDLDLLVRPAHASSVFFYRQSHVNSSNFFEVGLLKDALSKVLVLFYPMAGRLGRDQNGRIEVNCNGEGVLFMETETSYVIDDLGDFSDSYKFLPLVPTIDDTKDISSYPLLLTQVTHFKCGGVTLGVGWHHTLGDASSKFHFINAWTEMTRGFPISVPPFFDRTILDVGIPSSPTFHHSEYDPIPSLNRPTQNPGCISNAILKLSLDQINTLKAKSKENLGSTTNYSKFEVIAAHIWRCMCKARHLSHDQLSKLFIPTNGRSRLNPPLPYGYFGNVLFTTTLIASSSDVQSKPLGYTVEKIHKALKRMDDQYLKSALAYLKQQPDPTALRRGGHTFKSPNLNISNASNMSLYDANFGWGRPIIVRPILFSDGVTQIYPSPSNDGSLYVFTSLENHQVPLFKKFFYEIFVQNKNARSRY